jgi:hypothetical protein
VKPNVKVMGWRGHTRSAVTPPVGHTAKISKMTLKAYGCEINIQLSGNSSGGHSCSLHANCSLTSKLETSVAMCCVTNQHILVGFYCLQHKVHLCNEHALSSASLYATPTTWMDYLGKGEMLTNRDVNKMKHNI